MDNQARSKHLRECLRREVMMSTKNFSWFSVLHKALKCPNRRFYFWWRIASYWHHSNSKFLRKRAAKINRKLVFKYGTEIQLGAQIGPGMVITHHHGIVVNGSAVIGHSLRIRQNTTIGITGTNINQEPISLVIGNNVSIGAGTCIIAHKINIGDNVVIGAMTFVNKDIPSNMTVYSEKILHVVPNSLQTA